MPRRAALTILGGREESDEAAGDVSEVALLRRCQRARRAPCGAARALAPGKGRVQPAVGAEAAECRRVALVRRGDDWVRVVQEARVVRRLILGSLAARLAVRAQLERERVGGGVQSKRDEVEPRQEPCAELAEDLCHCGAQGGDERAVGGNPVVPRGDIVPEDDIDDGAELFGQRLWDARTFGGEDRLGAVRRREREVAHAGPRCVVDVVFIVFVHRAARRA
mmetsp:Transcript_431/g.1524  ORF Transcript_431/g.1524 Transcript_431/m.1524 type:complete len:222 (-) Transcript_431:285-950(-)